MIFKHSKIVEAGYFQNTFSTHAEWAKYAFDFGEGVENNNPDGYSVKNDTVDLSAIVDDLIMINSPVSFLCAEDCKGICLGCGVNLNDEQCKCKN